MKLTGQQKFEALIHRHQDMSNLLQTLTSFDLKIFTSFLTLQLVLGGFISQFTLTDFGKYGLFTIDIALALVCSLLLLNNKIRRVEIVDTIKNCNKALGYQEKDCYLTDEILNGKTKFRPWLWFYLLGNLISIIGVALILFIGSPKKKDNSNSITFSFPKEILIEKSDSTFMKVINCDTIKTTTP